VYGKEISMPKQLRCSDLMPGCTCTFVAEGDDAEELMAKAAQHARADHGIAKIPPEIERKARAVIGHQ
jgi:predicted small metal-binding protein